MDQILRSVQEYIKSGEYFVDARKWYNFKYVHPVVQRSFLSLFCFIFFILSAGVIVNIYSVLPLTQQIRYAIESDSFKSSGTIINADQFENDPTASIADVMIKNYVMHRESYDYNLLKNQFLFVQNNSTRIIYKQFADFMNLDNTMSPVMRYQKSFRRTINIISVSYSEDGEAIVNFESLAKNSTNDILENMIWQATIDFEMDPISLNLPTNSRFNFVVTNYKLKLLKDKNNK